MLKGFEKFTQTGKCFVPKVSIQSHGLINFSEGAINRFNISDYNYAILYYNSTTKQIGIELVKNIDKNNDKLLKIRKKPAINAKAFFDYFDINITNQKDLSLSKQGNLLIFDLGGDDATN